MKNVYLDFCNDHDNERNSCSAHGEGQLCCLETPETLESLIELLSTEEGIASAREAVKLIKERTEAYQVEQEENRKRNEARGRRSII